jgi:hypothetical protein
MSVARPTRLEKTAASAGVLTRLAAKRKENAKFFDELPQSFVIAGMFDSAVRGSATKGPTTPPTRYTSARFPLLMSYSVGR